MHKFMFCKLYATVELGFCHLISDAFKLDSWPCLLLVSSTTGHEMARICGRINRKRIDQFLNTPVTVCSINLPGGLSTTEQFAQHFRVQVLFDACQQLVGEGPIMIRYVDDTGTTLCIDKHSTGKIKDYILNRTRINVHRVDEKVPQIYK